MKEQNTHDRVLSDSFFNNTLDGLAYCKMIFNPEGIPIDFLYIDVNKNFEKLTGLKNVAGKKVSEIMPIIISSNPELLEICGRVSKTGVSKKEFEVYIEPLAKWFFASVYCPKNEFFVAVFQNITARKLIEKDLENAKIAARNVLEDLQTEKETLAHAKAKDEAMLASIGDGVIIVDLAGKITFINQSAQDVLGWESAEVMGKSLFDVVPIEDESGEMVSAKARSAAVTLATGVATWEEGKEGVSLTTKTTPGIYYYIRKDKTKFPVAMNFSRVILDNKIVGAIEVFRDITREKEIDKAKSEFVSLASHQLRTPLTTISWYTEMILRGDVGVIVPSQKKYLEEIYQGNKRMVELVNTLLDVSQIELGTFKVESKPTDIIALAQSVLDEQKQNIGNKRLITNLKLGNDIPTFSTDSRLLRMVFQNLIANAVMYTPANGNIEFSITLQEKKNIFIKISDTGYGIPKDQQSQIFTKLFRADNVRDKDTNGTGLGLYLAKSIVEKSGGKIWFESEENKGTTFFVSIPLHGVIKVPETGHKFNNVKN